MATVVEHQISFIGFASRFAFPKSTHLFRSSCRPLPQHFPAFSFSFSRKVYHPFIPLRVSSGGLPSELDEDSKFVPLNPEDPRYGPPALLLLGFKLEEADQRPHPVYFLDNDRCACDTLDKIFAMAEKAAMSHDSKLFALLQIQKLLKGLDGEFLKVIYCTEDMITHSLWDAVNTGPQALGKLKIAESLPRICFLSGLSGEEMIMFIDAFQESGLEPAVFAALVPNSSAKPLQELIEEIMADHQMTKKQSGSIRA
ncbi:hypothetical protein Cgig2_003657 [Carnegiea gigantea]|uniref:Uncharacterized protein n=1 Tax=Carnegiea gigantea TaxID=171969 RepID=A0A9Q1GTA8_9CARY|nr:hypothetical protein Cgig2_003657 [Carnegiea gigantea]